mgnify:FL=1
MLDDESDELFSAKTSDGDDEIFVASSSGKVSHFKESALRNTGRTSMGVKSMDLDENEEVISLEIINKECQLLALTDKGYGKRTNSSEFRLTSRGTKGVKAGVFNEKTGNLVSLIKVEDNQDLLVMADNGVVIRTPVKDIPLISRSTQGVRIMKLREGCKIVSVAVGDHEEEEEQAPVTAENLVVEQIANAENENKE